jgi:hypothetical protein
MAQAAVVLVAVGFWALAARRPAVEATLPTPGSSTAPMLARIDPKPLLVHEIEIEEGETGVLREGPSGDWHLDRPGLVIRPNPVDLEFSIEPIDPSFTMYNHFELLSKLPWEAGHEIDPSYSMYNHFEAIAAIASN